MPTRSEIAVAAEAAMRHLGTGPLAELRRGGAEPSPAAWRLIALHEIGVADRDLWLATFRITAGLIPRGDPAIRPAITRRVPLGQALADGGEVDWHPQRDTDGEAIPLFSQMRMQQLLSARGQARTDLLARACAMLALPPGTGVRPDDIAAALFHPDETARLAYPYYRRLVAAPHEKDSAA